MANYVFIDTSIYRELGFRFHKSLDYKNLYNFLTAIEGEIGLLAVVMEEFSNFYKQQLEKKLHDYKKITESLNRDPFFEKVEFLDISERIGKAIAKFQDQLHSDPVYNSWIAMEKAISVNSLDLTKFILESNNQGISNIQVRDYLIWESLIAIAKRESEDKVEKYGRRKVTIPKSVISFITKDKIFKENENFISRQKRAGISNINVFDSIPQFLQASGFNIPFVTAGLILSKITKEIILKDMSRDLGALLSYVSPRYSSEECDTRKVISAKIIEREAVEFYSYIDHLDSKAKYVANLKVTVKVTFAKDINFNSTALIKPERQLEIEGITSVLYPRYLETYDVMSRPYFNAPILFLYRGLLDMKIKTIKSVKFIDFMPDYYIDYLPFQEAIK